MGYNATQENAERDSESSSEEDIIQSKVSERETIKNQKQSLSKLEESVFTSNHKKQKTEQIDSKTE